DRSVEGRHYVRDRARARRRGWRDRDGGADRAATAVRPVRVGDATGVVAWLTSTASSRGSAARSAPGVRNGSAGDRCASRPRGRAALDLPRLVWAYERLAKILELQRLDTAAKLVTTDETALVAAVALAGNLVEFTRRRLAALGLEREEAARVAAAADHREQLRN